MIFSKLIIFIFINPLSQMIFLKLIFFTFQSNSFNHPTVSDDLFKTKNFHFLRAILLITPLSRMIYTFSFSQSNSFHHPSFSDDLFETNHFHFLGAILFTTPLSPMIFSKLNIFTFSEQFWLPVGFFSSTATSSLVCTPRLETFLIGRRTGGRWKTESHSSSSSWFFHENYSFLLITYYYSGR